MFSQYKPYTGVAHLLLSGKTHTPSVAWLERVKITNEILLMYISL